MKNSKPETFFLIKEMFPNETLIDNMNHQYFVVEVVNENKVCLQAPSGILVNKNQDEVDVEFKSMIK